MYFFDTYVITPIVSSQLHKSAQQGNKNLSARRERKKKPTALDAWRQVVEPQDSGIKQNAFDEMVVDEEAEQVASQAGGSLQQQQQEEEENATLIMYRPGSLQHCRRMSDINFYVPRYLFSLRQSM